MFEAAADGEIKALWIACTNPAQSMPDQALVRRALQRCEFVVVQEAYADTATAAFADLLLPATTWGEKDGTVTNSERRISRVRAAVPPPGQARADWADRRRRGAAAGAPAAVAPRAGTAPRCSPTTTPRRSGTNTARRTRGRDLDITGLDYAALDTAAAMAAAATVPPRAPRACTPTACSPRPTAARASSPRPGGRRPSSATRASRSR